MFNLQVGAAWRVLLVFFLSVVLGACASSDDVKGVADAANRAASGDAGSAAGSKRIELAAQVSQTGDQDQHNTGVEIQRNNSTTSSGATYSLASVAAGAGAAAAQKAIEEDPVVRSLRAELEALEKMCAEPEGPRPLERIDVVRAALGAQLDKLRAAYVTGSTPANVTGNTMIVIAPAAVGKDQPPPSAVDGELAKELAPLLAAIRGAPLVIAPPAPTSRPAADN